MDRVRRQLHLKYAYEKGLSGKNVTVCVLDTGISKHRDFDNRCVEFIDFTTEKRRVCFDDSGHGTHVCGILAGNGSASGGRFQGIAPEAKLIVGKILDKKGKGDMDNLYRGLEWVLNNQKGYGIRIVNISVGIPEKKEMEGNRQKREALQRYLKQLYENNILVVTAAGNLGPSANSLSMLGEGNQTICVGCHDGKMLFQGRKRCEDYSGRGPSVFSLRKPDVVAPGTEIVSCSNKSIYGYVKKSGTSMACPIVSGMAALYLEAKPDISIESFMSRIRFSAVDLGEPWSKQGYGMVDGGKMFIDI